MYVGEVSVPVCGLINIRARFSLRSVIVPLAIQFTAGDKRQPHYRTDKRVWIVRNLPALDKGLCARNVYTTAYGEKDGRAAGMDGCGWPVSRAAGDAVHVRAAAVG